MELNFFHNIFLKESNNFHRLAANYAALQQSLMKPKDNEEPGEDDE